MVEELTEKQTTRAEGEQHLRKVADTHLHTAVVEAMRIPVVDSLAAVLVGIQQEYMSRSHSLVCTDSNEWQLHERRRAQMGMLVAEKA